MSLIRFKNIPFKTVLFKTVLFKTVLFKTSRRLKLLFGLVLLSLPCAAVAYGSNAQPDPSSAFHLLRFSSSIIDFEFSKISMLSVLSSFVALLAGISFFKAAIFAKVGASQRLADLGLGILQIGLAISVTVASQIAVGEQQVAVDKSASSSKAVAISRPIGVRKSQVLVDKPISNSELMALQGASCGTITPQGLEISTAPSSKTVTTPPQGQFLKQATLSEVR